MKAESLRFGRGISRKLPLVVLMEGLLRMNKEGASEVINPVILNVVQSLYRRLGF